ncbi:MAG: phage integrase SAM-like domain-containing protein, partial [Burkholderiaceae bacterium]|nr:phage integrase SAM-like domain-containing protein [Burkholderiaceae bacterium]
MQKMLTNYTVSLADLQAPPEDFLVAAAGQPVAVLDQNRPLFYVVGPQLLQALMSGAAGAGPALPGAGAHKRTSVALLPAGAPLFSEVAAKLLALEADRARRGALSTESVQIMRNRLDAHLLPVFGHLPVDDVGQEHIEAFMERMGDQEVSSTTISQYLVILRKAMKLALSRKWINEIPEIPRVAITSQPRSTFTVDQYGRMLRTARRLWREQAEAPSIKQGEGKRERFWVTARYRTLPPDLYWVIGFM